nr:efflux RND transporter permease subunit [Portibacter lacus]
MVKYLIYRPIAVLTITLGLVVLSLFFGREVPISLLPDIPIPKISIQVSASEKTARVIENTITRPLRNQLLQLHHLEDLHSSSRNGSAYIDLTLRHGTDTDLSFIEANEKVDQAMSFLPRNIDRPRVIKSNISDIPVFYLAILPKNEANEDLRQLSEFTEKVIKRRLEQEEEIAFADLHGLEYPEVIVFPNQNLLQSLGINEEELASAISNSNIDVGNVIIRDGQYQYNVELSNKIEKIDDLKNVYVSIQNQIYQLKQLANIVVRPKDKRSAYTFEGKEGIIMSVRKKDDANNFSLKTKMDTLLADFKLSYPDLNFKVINDQSEVLEISYQNLRTSLLYGILFSSIILFFFFREWRLPLLIIITVPLGLLLALGGFYLLGLSINIISISGLILGVGLMIDNAIIIIDNIRQEQNKLALNEAITVGTKDVLKPLLSSAMTTCSVFLPLILISGIAGALFYDQAISISITLIASLLVSAVVLPVLARILMKDKNPSEKKGIWDKGHHKAVVFFLKNRFLLLVIFLILSALGIFLISQINRTAFPELSTDELEVSIDWNENIGIEESIIRVNQLRAYLSDDILWLSAIIGEKQFILTAEESSINESQLLIKSKSSEEALSLVESITAYLSQQFPKADSKSFRKKNTFDYLFSTDEYPLISYAYPSQSSELPDPEEIQPLVDDIKTVIPEFEVPPVDEFLNLTIRLDILEEYGVSYDALLSKLKTIFNANAITEMRSSDRMIPIVIGHSMEKEDFYDAIHKTLIQNKNGNNIPLGQFISVQKRRDYKSIKGTLAGEALEIPSINYREGLEDDLRKQITKDGDFFVSFGGSIYQTRKIISQLWRILLIVFILLYLILAAQFESLVQPILVLVDVPLSLFGGMLFLWIGGETLNLVSMVGLIITAGIIVNDAILKLDMINKNTRSGQSVDEAIIHASGRRLRPIVMTSITTILAFLPVLFSSGIGAEIQKPLALTVIGGLVVGTLSSLIFLPVLYRIFNPKRVILHKSTKT